MKFYWQSWWHRLPFAGRLFITASTVLLVATLSLIVTTAQQEVTDAHSDLQHFLDQELKTLPGILAETVVLGDYATLKQALKQHASQPLIQKILFTDPQGTAIDSQNLIPNHQVPRWFLSVFQYPTLSGTTDLTLGGYTYGILTVTASSYPLAVRAWQRLRRTMAILLLTVTLDFLAIWLTLRFGLRPLQQLELATTKLAAGQLNTRLELTGSPEFRNLLQQFNQMAQTIETTQNQLLTSQHQLQQAKNAAEIANRSKSQFLAHMSHEIRTPLNAVLGLLQLLQHTGLKLQQQTYADKARSAGQVLLGIINNILDLSKIEANKLELEQTRFFLDQWLQELSALITSTHPNTTVALAFEVDPQIPNALRGDALRLKQILLNLANNATKFTQQGTVTIALQAKQVTADSAQIEYSVSDTGIGIPADRLHTIFESFEQASVETTRQYGGTGLGLTISQRLVRLMGGELQVVSKVGQGSRFFFTLGLSRDHSPSPEAPSTSQADPPPLSGLRLLVVEDNPLNQEVAQKLLLLSGAQVECASNGQEGISRIITSTLPFDAVLMDMQMPILDGCAATRCLRQDYGLTTLIIIAMTANALDSDRQACLAAGMNDYVSKPIDIVPLVATLLRHCRTQPNAIKPKPDTINTCKPYPGLRLAEALARLDYDCELFFEMLQKFKPYQQEVRGRLRYQLQHNNQEAASRELHMLKGIARTLGAETLADFIQAAEAAINTQTDNTTLITLPDRLDSLLDETVQLLDTLTLSQLTATITPVCPSASPALLPMPESTRAQLDN